MPARQTEIQIPKWRISGSHSSSRAPTKHSISISFVRSLVYGKQRKLNTAPHILRIYLSSSRLLIFSAAECHWHWLLEFSFSSTQTATKLKLSATLLILGRIVIFFLLPKIPSDRVSAIRHDDMMRYGENAIGPLLLLLLLYVGAQAHLKEFKFWTTNKV